MLKFLHLIGGTTFLGIIIASFFYIAHSIHQRDRSLIAYSLKASYFGDAAILLIVSIQLLTAFKLAHSGHFTLAVPWIFIAYHAFGLLLLVWLSLFFIKLLYLAKLTISPTAVKFFYLLNTLIILIFFIIIHDAVTQSTWFDFLFRK